jgi:peptide/nickel transport system substrate-binding protein
MPSLMTTIQESHAVNRPIFAVALTIVTVLWGAACQGPDKHAGSGDSATPTAPAQVLVFGRGADSVGLDAAHEEDGESFKVAELIFDTLVQYADDSTDIEPGLATSWASREDGLVWEFTLREGVRFHDGTDVNADAVVFSLERQRDEGHPFHNIGGPYIYWVSLGMSDRIESVTASGPMTVDIRLRAPYSPLIQVLATPPFAIVSPTAVAAHGPDFGSNPVGSGPFRFGEWRRADRIILERNEEFWGGSPTLERIVFRAIPEAHARALELENGAIHLLDSADPEDVNAMKDNPELRVVTTDGMNVGYVAMNTTHAPLDDPRVRYAINHAIDKQAIVDALYGGRAITAKNPIPPTIWGYNDEVEDFAHDPDAARALIAEALPDGFPEPLSFYVMTNPRPYFPDPDNIGLAIQSDLATVGVPVQIETFEWGTYLERVKEGKHDLAMLGWSADYAHPDNFLYFLLSKTNAQPPQASNIAFYRSDELEELLLTGVRETDPATLTATYRAAQELVRKDAPWVIMAHAKRVAVVRSNVEGFALHPISWRPLWRARIGAE